MHHFYLLLVAIVYMANPTFAQTEVTDFENQRDTASIEIDSASRVLWHIGQPNKTVFDSALSLPNAIVTDTALPYPENANASFIYKFKWQGAEPSVSFKHKLDADSLDGGYVELSIDSGMNWLLLSDTLYFNLDAIIFANYVNVSNNFYSLEDTLFNGVAGFSGSIDQWEEVRIWFPCATVRSTPEVWLRFTFVSDSLPSNRDGWIIDDLRYEGFGGICASIEESQNLHDKMAVAPNPVTDRTQFSMKTGQLQNATFEVLDVTGKRITTETQISGSTFSWSKEDLHPGFYFYRFSEGGKPVAAGRLVVE